MMKNNLCRLMARGKELYQENCVLFVSSIFIPLIAPLFFYCPTSILRAIFYASIPFIGALIIKNWNEIKQLLSQDKIIWRVMAIFVLFMSASVFWSDHGEASRYFSKGKLFLILGMTTVSTFYISYKYPKFSDLIKNFYILGATSSAIILVGQHLLTHGFTIETTRLEGMGRATNPVQASLMYGLAVIAIIFGNFSSWLSTRQTIIAKTLMILPSLGVILLTQSRGPFLALLITLAAFCIIRSKHKIRSALFMVIGLCVLAFPCYGVLKDTRVLERKTTGRFEIWDTSIHQIMHKPIFGNGLAVANRYTYKNGGGTITAASHIHSLYLSTLFQGGIIGLGLLLSIYLLFANKFRQLIQNQPNDHLWLGGWVVMGAAFGIADFGGIIINLSTEWLVFWWPIALVLGHIARQKQAIAASPIPQ